MGTVGHRARYPDFMVYRPIRNFMKRLLIPFLFLSAARAEPTLPPAIQDALVVSCARITQVNQINQRYLVTCQDPTGRTRTYLFRVDDDGYLYFEGQS